MVELNLIPVHGHFVEAFDVAEIVHKFFHERSDDLKRNLRPVAEPVCYRKHIPRRLRDSVPERIVYRLAVPGKTYRHAFARRYGNRVSKPLIIHIDGIVHGFINSKRHNRFIARAIPYNDSVFSVRRND